MKTILLIAAALCPPPVADTITEAQIAEVVGNGFALIGPTRAMADQYAAEKAAEVRECRPVRHRKR